MTKILIAIPTAKYIESETFKSIYDLIIPPDVQTDFQVVHGYTITQLRNLIADMGKQYDYVFSVDSDIVLPPDILVKLLNHRKYVVGGLYIQRKPDKIIPEVFHSINNGNNHIHVPFDDIGGTGLQEVDAIGFGCVLINSKVYEAVGYPQFEYHMNGLEIAESEDINFCKKARHKGYSIWCDTDIICPHIGQTYYLPPKIVQTPNLVQTRLRSLSQQRLIPKPHVEYLQELKKQITPKVIYDIGACVLHWTHEAKRIWPYSEYYAIEGMEESQFIFEEEGIPFAICLLSDKKDSKGFYVNPIHPGGNSYYQENTEAAKTLFPDSAKRIKETNTLDNLIQERNWPQPDLIKMDVQGAEFDILKGSLKTLDQCKDLILELQTIEYNKGAPLAHEVIDWLAEHNFELVSFFSNNGVDGDYHFRKIKE